MDDVPENTESPMAILEAFIADEAYADHGASEMTGPEIRVEPRSPETTRNVQLMCEVNGVNPNFLHFVVSFVADELWAEQRRRKRDVMERAVKPICEKLKHLEHEVKDLAEARNRTNTSREGRAKRYENPPSTRNTTPATCLLNLEGGRVRNGVVRCCLSCIQFLRA